MSRKIQRAAPGSIASRHQTPPIVFVGMSFVIVLMFALLARHSGAAVASAHSTTAGDGRHIWCGLAGQPACPTADPGWVSVSSSMPAAALTAISSHKMFSAFESRFGHFSPDLPVLVHPYGVYGPASDYYLDDHWVVAVRNSAGQECGIFDFVYDRAHQRLRFSSFDVLTSQDPRFGKAFPYISSNVAQSRLLSQLHEATLVGVAPALIFFPIATGWIGPQASHTWTLGGDSPVNPVWLLTGADGHTYFIGSDLRVHAQGELPIAPAAPVQP